MKNNVVYRLDNSRWSINRIIYLVAGSMVIIFNLLIFLNDGFIWLSFFLGLMLINFSLTGYCPMAILLHKIGIRE